MKFDGGKLPWHLFPFDAAAEVVKVLQFGAKKYAARNWERGIAHSRTFAATQRHLVAWFYHGEDHDPETGIHHLAHAGCEVLFALAFETRGQGALVLDTGETLDDRPCRVEPKDEPGRPAAPHDTTPSMTAVSPGSYHLTDPEEPTEPGTPSSKAAHASPGQSYRARLPTLDPSALERHRVDQ